MTYGPFRHNPQHPVSDPDSPTHAAWRAEQAAKRQDRDPPAMQGESRDRPLKMFPERKL